MADSDSHSVMDLVEHFVNFYKCPLVVTLLVLVALLSLKRDCAALSSSKPCVILKVFHVFEINNMLSNPSLKASIYVMCFISLAFQTTLPYSMIGLYIILNKRTIMDLSLL